MPTYYCIILDNTNTDEGVWIRPIVPKVKVPRWVAEAAIKPKAFDEYTIRHNVYKGQYTYHIECPLKWEISD